MEETKSKRSNILFTPSVYEDLQILSVVFDTSVNDILHELAKKYIEENSSLVNLYRERDEIKTKMINQFIEMSAKDKVSLVERLTEIENAIGEMK